MFRSRNDVLGEANNETDENVYTVVSRTSPTNDGKSVMSRANQRLHQNSSVAMSTIPSTYKSSIAIKK